MAGLDPDLSSYGGYANTNKLLATAGNTADNANGWLTAARQQTALQSGQQQLSAQRLAAVNQIAGAVLADPTPENAVSSITQGIRMGVIPADEGAKELATVASFGGDTGKIKQYAFDHVQRIATVQQQMEAGGMAAPSYQNVGNKLIGVQSQSGLHPQMNVVGGPQPTLQPSPEFQATPASVQKPDGTLMQTNMAGRNAAIAGGGGAVPGPSPMLESGLKTYQEDQANSSAKMQGVQPLLNALPLIQALGPTGSGPSSAAFNKAKSTLVTLGIISPDTANDAAYDEASKYLKQYVMKSPVAGRSDMGSLMTEASSPNLETRNKATVELTKNSIAMDRMQAATPFAFKGTDYSAYGQHKAGFTQGQDLRAYKIDLMAPAERAALMKSMLVMKDGKFQPKDTPEAKKFWQSVQNAHDAHVLTPVNSGVPTNENPNGQ